MNFSCMAITCQLKMIFDIAYALIVLEWCK